MALSPKKGCSDLGGGRAVLPPVLEIYAVWHPADTEGERVAQTLLDHFRGTTFSGLIGGAVEVYVRSESATDTPGDAPRPLPCTDPMPYGVPSPAMTAVVLVAGTELAKDIQLNGPWQAYVQAIVAARLGDPTTVGLFTVVTGAHLDNTALMAQVGRFQAVTHGLDGTGKFMPTLCRDVAQGIAQMRADAMDRVRVFVSHTKRLSTVEQEEVTSLVDVVRGVITNTRLAEFFDAHDLQVNEDWTEALIAEASTGALLAVRTDLYSSRPWCQQEVLTAKRHGVPVVVLDALITGEERGSFVMDHVPRSPGRLNNDNTWRRDDVVRALGQLVDECLKRVLWAKQKEIAAPGTLPVQVDWWAPHAPEPATFADWLSSEADIAYHRTHPIVVLHPDPPLGAAERDVLVQFARLMDLHEDIKFLTPRGLAARGG